jgi:tetratricopeptide (TPR) repeat protein
LATQGMIDEAINFYRLALQIDPNNASLRRMIVNIFMRKGQFDAAIQEYLDWARFCQDSNLPVDAINIYQEIISIEKTIAQKPALRVEFEPHLKAINEIVNGVRSYVYLNMGIILQAMGHLDEAIQYLRACLDLSPEDAQIHMALGQAYMRKSLDKEALCEFQEVIRHDPSEAAYAYEMLGELHIKRGGNPQGIVAWFRKAADLYVKNNQLDDTIRVYERMLSFDPRDKDVLNKLGESYAQKGAMQQAVKYSSILAQIYTEEGLPDKVVDLYERIICCDPENMEIREILVTIYRHILEIDPSNLSTRRKLISNLLILGSAEATIPEFLSLASGYLDKGMLEDSMAVCQKLLELDPSIIKAIEIQGEIYARQGKQKKALDQFLRVLKILQERGDDQGAARLYDSLVTRFPGMLKAQ